MLNNNFMLCLVLMMNTAIISSGCRQMIRSDMDTYLQNRDAYRGKKILFAAELHDLVHRYELYKGKYVELTAPVVYNGREGFYTWYIMLEEEGDTIRAYEDHYWYFVNHEAIELLFRASEDGGEITVRGKLKEDGIEIKEMIFQNRTVDTDFIPREYRRYWSGGSKPQREYHNSWVQWNVSPGMNFR